MSYLKKRINLTVDSKTYSFLKFLSAKKQQKISTLSLKLIHKALEEEEDLFFSKLGDKILSQKGKRFPHHKAW